MPPTFGLSALNDDQRAAAAASRGRWQAWAEARAEVDTFKGSLVWIVSKGEDYLVRAAYEPDGGRRRQISLGPRSPETEAAKRAYDEGREAARARLAEAEATLDRQAAINRVLALGRVPLLAARIVRALDRAGWLGTRFRVAGALALQAAAAVADRHLDEPDGEGEIGRMRHELRLLVVEPVAERGLLDLLRRVDRSFRRLRSGVLATDGGFRVEPFAAASPRETVDDIERLAWFAGAPALETVAVDERGHPLRLVVADPRVAAAGFLWAAGDLFRDPATRARDETRGAILSDLLRDGPGLPPLPAASIKALPRPVAEVLAGFGRR